MNLSTRKQKKSLSIFINYNIQDNTIYEIIQYMRGHDLINSDNIFAGVAVQMRP